MSISFLSLVFSPCSPVATSITHKALSVMNSIKSKMCRSHTVAMAFYRRDLRICSDTGDPGTTLQRTQSKHPAYLNLPKGPPLAAHCRVKDWLLLPTKAIMKKQSWYCSNKTSFKKKIDSEPDTVPGPWLATCWPWVSTFWLCLLHFESYSMGTSTQGTSVTQPRPWRDSHQQDSVVITAKAWAINFIAQQYCGPSLAFCWFDGEWWGGPRSPIADTLGKAKPAHLIKSYSRNKIQAFRWQCKILKHQFPEQNLP